MFVYTVRRRAALTLRSIQTALLGASFFVSDYAQRNGEAARTAAHASLDRKIDQGYADLDLRREAVAIAQARADEAEANFYDMADDVNERRRLLELEVL